MRVEFVEGGTGATAQLAAGWVRALAADGVEAGTDRGTSPSADVARVLCEVGIAARAAVVHAAADHVIAAAPAPGATAWSELEAGPLDLASLRATRDQLRERVRAWLGADRCVRFGAAVRDEFVLQPGIAFVNHGSFGAAPRVVLEAQRALQDELEAQPLAFMRSVPDRMRSAAARVASFLGAQADDVVFVDNATTGCNAVLRSLPLGPGDAMLTTSHAYGAVSRTLEYVAARTGARLRIAQVPFPLDGPDAIVRAVEDALHDDVRVAVFDHISSITGLVFPVQELVALCHARGVRVLVDGAHVPGQLPLDLEAIGADWYVGNLHKWAFAPKGCAVLHARPEAQDGLHPPVISHGYGQGYTAEFDWVGTRDPSAWLASGAALDFVEHHGADRVRAYDIALRQQAQARLAARWGVEVPAPRSMIAALGALPVPVVTDGSQRAADALNLRVWHEHRVEAMFMSFEGRLWVRVVAQMYNTLDDFDRLGDALEALRVIDTPARVVELAGDHAHVLQPRVVLVHRDAHAFLASLPDRSVHAVVTDPPYGLVEYEPADHDKLRRGRGGVWRIPPTLDGVTRRPVPRFTVLTERDLQALDSFFEALGRDLLRVLVPGGHVILASNPLVSTRVFGALSRSGLHKRGEIVRLVTTLRGGDRPKNAHEEFPDVSVMPRSGWEPWGLFRTPLDGTVAETLRRWGTGGLRRLSETEPFRDVIRSAPTRAAERRIADHPSLKPQAFLRAVVRGALPLGTGIVLDPFAGSGSTLAAAAAVGYAALGSERDGQYVELARRAFVGLRDLDPGQRASGTP